MFVYRRKDTLFYRAREVAMLLVSENELPEVPFIDVPLAEDGYADFSSLLEVAREGWSIGHVWMVVRFDKPIVAKIHVGWSLEDTSSVIEQSYTGRSSTCRNFVVPKKYPGKLYVYVEKRYVNNVKKITIYIS